ncbi:MAG: DNA-3-methyladenine glycosylase I [Bacteroidota bacterium]
MNEPKRCAWVENTFDLYYEYHDKEWGVPVHDEKKLFEFLILEGAQAGLSWSTILNKREGYRRVFADFDPEEVARFSESQIQGALLDPGIIRNKLKVRSAVTNAQRFLEVHEEFGTFDSYIWAFVDGKPIINNWKTIAEVPVTTDISDRLSKDLKKRGFKFVGSTIIYALMQAIGMVNDHTVDCFRHKELS